MNVNVDFKYVDNPTYGTTTVQYATTSALAAARTAAARWYPPNMSGDGYIYGFWPRPGSPAGNIIKTGGVAIHSVTGIDSGLVSVVFRSHSRHRNRPRTIRTVVADARA